MSIFGIPLFVCAGYLCAAQSVTLDLSGRSISFSWCVHESKA